MYTIETTVREWGACTDSGAVPHKLSDLIAALNEAMAEIPPQFMEAAEVDCEPSYEFGETYERVRVTYRREMSQTEREEWRASEREHWDSQLDEAIKRAEYCRKQLSDIDGGSA